MLCLGIVGAGNMGSAFYRGIAARFRDLMGGSAHLHICDRNTEKLHALSAKVTHTDLNKMIPHVDAVLFAIKPQSFSDAISGLTHILKDKLILSVMAGVSCDEIAERTGSSAIIRMMPNLPVAVGAGVIAWYATPLVNEMQTKFAHLICDSLGLAIRVDTEEKIDRITALSGSGPAYFFYITELLEKKALALGFSEDQAKTVAEQTSIGAAKLLERSMHGAKALRKAVTSPGGTTEAAFKVLAAAEFEKIFFSAVDAGVYRAGQLSKKKS